MKIQTTKIYAEIDNAVKQGYTTISLQGSSRSSKTYNTLIWLIVYAIQHAHTRISIVRATLPALRSSTFVDFKEIMQKMKMWNDKSFSKSEFVYTMPNESIFEFFSVSDEQRLRGRKRDVLYVNECTELDLIEWQQLKMRTTRFSIVDYNPSFTEEHWLNSINAESKTYHFISTFRDNPFLEQNVIDELMSLKYKNEALWKIYGLGQRAVVEGRIIPNYTIIDHFPESVSMTYYGLDFGYTNDPTALVKVGRQGDNLYINEIIYRTALQNPQIAKLMQANGIARLDKIVADSAELKSIDEINSIGGFLIVPVVKGANSVVQGLEILTRFNIHITRRSTNIIREANNYVWETDRNGKSTNRPIDLYNHAIDAVRYVCMRFLHEKGKSVYKSSLGTI